MLQAWIHKSADKKSKLQCPYLSCTPSAKGTCNNPESPRVTFLIIPYLLALFAFNKIISIYMGSLIPKPFANEAKEMQPSPSQLAEERKQKAQMSLPHAALSSGRLRGLPSQCLPAHPTLHLEASLTPSDSPQQSPKGAEAGGWWLVGQEQQAGIPGLMSFRARALSPGQLARMRDSRSMGVQPRHLQASEAISLFS